MLIRRKYLELIYPFIESDLIKVITGMRRSGKSVLLSQLRDKVLTKGVLEKNIQYMNFESLKYRLLYNAESLYEYLVERLDEDDKNYLFFDEIQLVKDFEKVLNSLRVDFDVSIFVTGSNADLLSGEFIIVFGSASIICTILSILDERKW